jgi:ribosomal protein S15P/S13E
MMTDIHHIVTSFSFSVPDSVKKLYKLHNSYRSEIANYVRRKRNEKFQRHPFDQESHEVMIANYTSKIRMHQQLVRQNPNQVMSKIHISSYTNKRKRYLKDLWIMDKDRYYAIVKGLGIKHNEFIPGVKDYGKIMRKKSLRELTDAYCTNMKKAKLEAFHEKLKSQQEPFMKQKEETLKWIDDEIKKYQITEDELKTGFKPRPRYRDPNPVRPLVAEIE